MQTLTYSKLVETFTDDDFQTLVINRRKKNESAMEVCLRVDSELQDAAIVVEKFVSCQLMQDEFDSLCEYVVIHGAQVFLQSSLLHFINTGLLHRASREIHRHELAMQVNNVIASYKMTVNTTRLLDK